MDVQTRRCIGSTRFGIEGHDAPATDFPAQPSQKDGLGRMCRPHWNQYTNGLRKAALARKAADQEAAATSKQTKGAGTTKPASRKQARAPKPESPKVRKAKSVTAAREE